MNSRTIVASLLASVLLAAPLGAAEIDHKDTAFGRPGDPAKVTRTVRIEATEIDFNIHDLTVKTGETIKFVLVNKGQQNHELMIADAATEAEHRQMMADMPGMDHEAMEQAMGGHADDDHNSVDTKPGETKSFVWQFTKPGTFEFACNYPGHAELGMAGKIKVQ